MSGRFDACWRNAEHHRAHRRLESEDASDEAAMIAFLVRRTIIAGLTIVAISVVSFLVVQPFGGDSVNTYLELLVGASTDESAAGVVAPRSRTLEALLRSEYAVNEPVVVRYADWAWDVVRLDFGRTFSTVMRARLVNTVLLVLGTIVFTWVLAFPIGVYSAVRHNTPGDYAVTFVGFLGLAIPDFLLALALLWISFAWFGFSVGGLYSPEYVEAQWSFARVVDLLKHLWIPALVLGTAGTAGLIRILRNNLLDELGKPYVLAARARGVPEWKLVLKYPVRIALNPFVSTMGYLLPFLLSGSIIVSVVLSLPTLGPVLLDAFLRGDVFLGAAMVFWMGVLTVIGTLISDILLFMLDPRIRPET